MPPGAATAAAGAAAAAAAAAGWAPSPSPVAAAACSRASGAFASRSGSPWTFRYARTPAARALPSATRRSVPLASSDERVLSKTSWSSGVSSLGGISCSYSGPLIPPSFRILQKWTARNRTRMNGKNRTWNTYQRKRVSGPTSRLPRRMNFAWVATSGEYPARFVPTVTAQMQRHGEHHQVGTPSVHVPDQVAEEHPGPDGLHVVVRHGVPQLRRGAIEEHQVDTSDGEQDEQEERESTQAERIGEFQAMSFDLYRVKVVQDVVHHGQRPVALRVLVALPEDRPGPEHRLPELGLPDVVQCLYGPGRLWQPVPESQGSSSSFPSGLFDVDIHLLRSWHRGHRAAPTWFLLGQARIVQAVAGATLDAHGAPRARVVVHDEDGEGVLDLRLDGVVLGAADDPRVEHEDAVPRTDVLARPAQDAGLGVEHQVLGGPDSLLQPLGVNGLDRVIRLDVDFGLHEGHGVTSPSPASPVATGWTALALAAKPPSQSLKMVGDHDETPKGDAEQDDRDHVSKLELDPLQRARAGTGAPPKLLVGEVQPPGGQEPYQADGQEPQGERGHHRLRPGPFEVSDESLEPENSWLGPLLHALRYEPGGKLHAEGPS